MPGGGLPNTDVQNGSAPQAQGESSPTAGTPDGAKSRGKTPWRQFAAKYEQPDYRSWAVLADSLIPFSLGLYLMYRSLEVSYWLTMFLSLPTVGFYMRAFAIFHDTTHFIWFKSQRANVILGTLLGWLTGTPFWQWRAVHVRHHAALGNLDRRSEPQIKTLTVREYLGLPRLKRLAYRLFRNPLVLMVLGGAFSWLALQRFVAPTSVGARERHSVYTTNLVLGGLLVAAHYTIGVSALLMILGPLVLISATVGVWIYYVQHQYEDTYWAKAGTWNYSQAALQGSIFLRVSPWFDWCTGYFTWHAMHHLLPRIPFYRLPECYRNERFWADLKEHSLAEAWKAMFLTLWDEDNQRLVGWDSLKSYELLPVRRSTILTRPWADKERLPHGQPAGRRG